ncbi:MAG TPA: VWA domain-containing protein [Thermoanaerobaculia bacterium]|jgi:Ca-activated chloride channel family protein|nr:VWA domain-containing protein [Thermoanaerobaculia bacterium]
MRATREPGRALIPALALGLLLAAAARAQVAVRILSPEPGQPVFGATDVRVGVQPGPAIDRVEIYVNGKLAGTARTPPYHVQVDVGEDNVQREFRAVAYTPTGATGSDSVVTQPVMINDEMSLKLRALFVSVTRNGQRALDLGKEDFQVLDNGSPQEIVTFGRDELPLTAVLLLDTSESMQGKRQEAVRRGAKAFLDGMKPADEAMLALFSDRLLRFTPFTSQKSTLESAIAGTQAAGGTAVNDFLYMSLKLLDARQGQRVVVLFSDGSDVHSVLPASDVLWKSRAGQALIYWIQLGGKHESFTSSWRDFKANDQEYRELEQAVEASGGRILTIERLEDLEGAFRNVLKDLREQYAVGYYPNNAKADGKWHKLDVRVKGGARARTREGYADY